MTGIAYETVAALAAFVTSVVVGYRCWGFRRRMRERTPALAQQAKRRHAGLLAAAPLVSGLVVGMGILCLSVRTVAAHDRFYTPGSALGVALWVLVGGLIIISGEVILAATIVARAQPWADDRVRLENRGYRQQMAQLESRTLKRRWLLDVVLELCAAIVVVAAGIRFREVGIGAERVVSLGGWSASLTVLWLVGATNVAKLLDGIEGAANVLLLVAAVTVFCVTLGTAEHFLNAFALVTAAAVLASLRFNFYPARLPLGGSGTAFAGFIFAVLTVLARQKTVTALLLVFPLLVVVLLVGGAMLTLLERTVSIGEDHKR